MKQVILFTLIPGAAFSQSRATLEECQQKAMQHFPLVKQEALLKQIERDKLRSTATARWPQNELTAQATTQSEVPTLPVKLPNVSVIPVDKDQYRITDEVKLLIYDGGDISARKALIKAQTLAELQKTNVDLYAIKMTVTQLYSNITETDARIDLLKVLEKNITDRMIKVKAGVQAGTVLVNNLYVLQAEQLKIDQQISSAHHTRYGLIMVMNIYTGDDYNDSTRFDVPQSNTSLTNAIARPEISLFQYQRSVYRQQSKLVNTGIRPRLSAFFQGGVGRPGLNILDNSTRGFYITGLRANWSLGALYNFKRDKEVLLKQQKMVDAQQESFELKIRGQLAKQKEEILRLKDLLTQDNDIIAVRTKVKDISAAQLDAGIITSSDYLTDLNEQNQALLNQKIHQIELVFAYIEYGIIAG